MQLICRLTCFTQRPGLGQIFASRGCYTLSRSSESSKRPDARLPLLIFTLVFLCMLAVWNESVACQVERPLRMIAGHFVSSVHYPARGACYMCCLLSTVTQAPPPLHQTKTLQLLEISTLRHNRTVGQ